MTTSEGRKCWPCVGVAEYGSILCSDSCEREAIARQESAAAIHEWQYGTAAPADEYMSHVAGMESLLFDLAQYLAMWQSDDEIDASQFIEHVESLADMRDFPEIPSAERVDDEHDENGTGWRFTYADGGVR